MNLLLVRRSKNFFLLGCFSLALLAVVLSACTPAQETEIPSLQPQGFLGTAIALTVQAGQPGSGLPGTLQAGAQVPTLSPTATGIATSRPSLTPAPESTPTPAQTATPTQQPPTASPLPTVAPPALAPTLDIPDAAIQILEPGPQSRVVSPLHLNTYIKPGLDGRVQIELIGEDGRLLVRKVITYRPEVGRIYLTEDLDFEIRQVGETARLQISTFDTNQRLLAFSSVDVILLTLGENDINPPGSLQERVIIDEPLPNKLIQGGTLVVSGHALPSGEQPLLIELTTAAGKVVGYRQAALITSPENSVDSSDYLPFRVEVPYTVAAPTWVRLSVREDSGGRLEGPVYVTSFEILLSP